MTQFADVLVFNSQGQILFLRRSWKSNFEPSKLGLPGGHVDPGEQPLQAAYRELKEETGLAAFHLTPLTERKFDDKEIYYYSAVLTNTDEEIPLIVLDEDEHTNYEFKSLEEVEFCQDEEFILDLRDYILTEVVKNL